MVDVKKMHKKEVDMISKYLDNEYMNIYNMKWGRKKYKSMKRIFKFIKYNDSVPEYIRREFVKKLYSEIEKQAKKEINNIYIASIFHDIGKAFLDQGILNQPFKLSDEDRAYIQTHSYLSYKEIINSGLSVEIALIVLYHHENYDGTGYPTGLSGCNIPIGARILKICDVFDALISDRPYRKALNIDSAINIMDKEIHSFDKTIYQLFINSFDLNNIKYKIK